MNISDSVFFTNSEKPMRAVVANSYPYIMIETSSNDTAYAFRDILTQKFAELSINNITNGNLSIISGSFSSYCHNISDKYASSFKNLTFNTNKNQDDGRIFHVRLEKLLYNITEFECELGLYLVYDASL